MLLCLPWAKSKGYNWFITNNPFINAASALGYILAVVTIILNIEKEADGTFLMPILVLSLFTLSAGAMAFFFFYQPFQLLFEGKKKQAIDLVFKSFAVFGGITLVILILVFSGAFQ